jgi:hypothetical protein
MCTYKKGNGRAENRFGTVCGGQICIVWMVSSICVGLHGHGHGGRWSKHSSIGMIEASSRAIVGIEVERRVVQGVYGSYMSSSRQERSVTRCRPSVIWGQDRVPLTGPACLYSTARAAISTECELQATTCASSEHEFSPRLHRVSTCPKWSVAHKDAAPARVPISPIRCPAGQR